MESADPIRDPAQLEDWWQAGLRLAGSRALRSRTLRRRHRPSLGLTELGAPLLREMSRLGMLLDLTHFSDEAFWEAVKIYDGPVLASHNNCRALVPHQRQFSDEQLKLII